MSAPTAYRAIPVLALTLAIFLLVSDPVTAQDRNSTLPAVEWQQIYGGPKSEVGYSAAPAPDGYLVLGVTQSYGNGSYDAWLMKLDTAGNMLWNRTYGGTGGDWLYGITPAADGNYLMAGATNSWSKGGFDIWIVKVNPNGDLIWSKTFGGPNYDAGFGIAPTPDGGGTVTGYWGVSSGDSDFVLIQVDENGDSVWDRMYQNGAQDWGKAIIATPDGGYAVGGWTKSTASGKAQAYLLKTDGNGTKQWDGIYGDVSRDTWGYGIVRTDDGGYILGGHTSPGDNGGVDIFGVKVDRNGGKLWEKSTGLSKDDYGFNAIPTGDSIMFGGYSSSFDPVLWKLYLVSTDNEGNILGYQSYGPENTSVKGGLALRTADNGYLFVGNTNEYGSGKDDVFVMKLSGSPAVPVASEDIVAKAALPVAAVAAGTGLSFLALFMGRIFDYLSEQLNKMWAGANDFWSSIMKLPVINAVYKLLYGYFNTYLKSMVIGRMNKIKVASAVERTPVLAGLSSGELGAIAISSVMFGLAYIIAKKLSLFQLDTLVIYIVVAGFVMTFHDLTHRYYAIKYKSVTEYKIWGFGALITFLTAFAFGVTYAVPARTVINNAGKMSPKEQAIVYFSGPLVSGILAFAFLLLVPFGGILRTIGLLGVSMNLLSAVYSLTPFQPMDGNKVYRWKKALWAVTFVPLLLMYLGITIFLT